jgi:hypothetical protein
VTQAQKNGQKLMLSTTWVAGVTGLEPAASGVTGTIIMVFKGKYHAFLGYFGVCW